VPPQNAPYFIFQRYVLSDTHPKLILIPIFMKNKANDMNIWNIAQCHAS